MSDRNENLYETRTNMLSSDKMVDYFFRHCDRHAYPFKPENAIDIDTVEVSSDRYLGKEIKESFEISQIDFTNSDLKGKKEYNLDLVAFKTYSFDKKMASIGSLALVYPSDRNTYALFLIDKVGDTKAKLTLLLKVKQKTSLFGSFENENVVYYF